jgi:hypothetical protein
MIKRGLLSFYVFAVAAMALVHSEAKASSVSVTNVTIVTDETGTVSGADPSIVPCSSAAGCVVNSTTTGANTTATIATSVQLNQIPIQRVLVPYYLQPYIQIQGEVSASPSRNATTFAGASSTATWTLAGGAEVDDSRFLSPTELNGHLDWKTNFNLQQSLNSIIQFTWTISGLNSVTNSMFSTSQTMTLGCTSTGCSVNTSSLNVGLESGNFIDALMDVSGCMCATWSLSETVNFQTSATAGHSGSFNFQDPMTLTYFDPNGNIVPNLVFYDQSLNGEIGLSGQDFSATTPVPAALPLFATGLGMMGFLGWRRKRKAAAIQAAAPNAPATAWWYWLSCRRGPR